MPIGCAYHQGVHDMGRWIFGLALALLWPVMGSAQNKPLKLEVSGMIAIDHSGAVYDYTIDSILTPEVKQVVDRSVRRWTFEPVMRDGKPVYAKSRMHLTLNALPVANGYALQIDRVNFSGSRVGQSRVPPKYPMEALRASVGASVLVAVRVDQAGDVIDAAAAQSTLLGVRASGRNQELWRKVFEKASVAAVRQWKFQPADVMAGDEPDATVLIPITFTTGDTPHPSGGWRSDLAGPQHPIPWLSTDKQHYDASGLTDSQSLTLNNPVRLKESMEGKAL